MKCKIDGIDVYYEAYGEGRPILMLHGFYADSRLMIGCMEPVFKNRNGYKRIYIDLPGMGKTNINDEIENADEILDVIMKFTSKIITDEKFLVIGESYGGYLARGIINKNMNSMGGVMLICPCIIPEREKRKLPKKNVIVEDLEFIKGLEPSDALKYTNMAVVQSEYTFKRYSEEILSGIKIYNRSFLAKIKRVGYGFSFEIDKLNKKYDKPTLILLGKQDSVVGYKDAFDILENYTRCSFVILDKAGHHLQIEQKELFERLTNEWLDRIENFEVNDK